MLLIQVSPDLNDSDIDILRIVIFKETISKAILVTWHGPPNDQMGTL